MSEGISVAILAKNCSKTLEECLISLDPFIDTSCGDEIVIVDTGSSDDTADMAESRGCRVFRHPELCASGMHDLATKYLPEDAPKLVEDPQFKDGFLADFAAARQIATDHCKNDLVFWIDSDDVLIGGAELRAFCRDYFTKPDSTHVFLQYDYSFDEDGACTTTLWRERICRRSLFRWAGVCHESMIPADGKPVVVTRFENAKISHKNGRHHTYSDIRNYAILRHAWDRAQDAKEWLDPRWEYYLGNACRGLSRWREAVRWYTRVLRRSGSREDRLSCALNIGYCHILFGRPWRAIDWFFQAQKIHAGEPRAFYGIARAHFELQRFRDCLLYTQLGQALGSPLQLTSVDPNAFDFYPGVFECLALKETGNVQAALQKAQEVASMRPGFGAATALYQDISNWAQLEQIKSAVGAVTSLAFSKEGALDIVRSIKPEVRKLIPELQVEAYCPAPKNSITFLCGTTHEPWDPTSCNTGVGGSEKMVIQLAEELAARGFRCDVYGSPREENRYRNFGGVTYKPAQAFNPTLERDILIVWRNWGYLDLPLKARKIFIDLHDVQNPADYTPERLAKLSGAFFKSEFHRSPVAGLVGDKAILTRNSIDPAAFGDPAPGPRNYKRVLFTSSGDRGLKRALRIFSRVKGLHPDAELRLFYGFTPLYLKRAAEVEYGHFGDEGCERFMLDYAEECFDLAERVGAQNLGRVGHQRLADELMQASAVLYPTNFAEISCMSAMEAQAAGCIPVCSTSGALPETVKAGVLLTADASDDDYVAALDQIFRKGPDLDDERRRMAAAAKESFSTKSLVDHWAALFRA